MPPDGVRTSQAQPSAMPALRARSNAANPLPVVWTSTSTTSTPEGVPVGIPRLASGQRRHHSRIVAPSVVASWKPWAVRGCFPPGAHGNTGTSWRVSIIEAVARSAAPDRAVTSRGLHRGAGAFIGAELFMATPCIAARTNHRPRAPRPGRLRGPGRAVFPQVNPARERKATEFGGPCVKPPLEIQRTLMLPTTSGLLGLHQPGAVSGVVPEDDPLRDSGQLVARQSFGAPVAVPRTGRPGARDQTVAISLAVDSAQFHEHADERAWWTDDSEGQPRSSFREGNPHMPGGHHDRRAVARVHPWFAWPHHAHRACQHRSRSHPGMVRRSVPVDLPTTISGSSGELSLVRLLPAGRRRHQKDR